ncbi:MAG: M20 family peptidase [Pseudomonadales bacterium]
MKSVMKGLAAIIGLVILVILFRTMTHTAEPLADVTNVDISLQPDVLAQHLSEAIQFRTISNQNSDELDVEAFEGFISWVAKTYPQVTNSLTLERLGYTLLYKWRGSDDSLQPILVTGHYDVVPVIPGTENIWEAPPFSGKISDGVIWGRGALDDKSGVIGILEAVTYLLREGYQPRRSVYLSFGHDEEVGGPNGAARVAALLKAQNVQLAWSLDEGSFLLDGMIPGVDKPIAAINVAEKGSITLDVVATAAGGHSSMPPKNNAVANLARAIVRLEENPVPGGLSGLGAVMFDNISKHMPFLPRMMFANRWLFGGMIEEQFSSVSFANAMIRTTTAPTMLSASIKTNVLPIEAISTVNFRIHPRDTVQSIEAHVSKVVAAEGISVRSRGGRNASGVSKWDADGYQQIKRSLQEIYGDVIVTPGLMIAGSDSRHYGKVADDAYRFNPFTLTPDSLTGFHGTNENISVTNFETGVKAYVQIIRNGSDH